MSKTNPRSAARQRRKIRIRKTVRGTAERPRLSVYRTARHIYAQLIDDDQGRTMASATTLGLELEGHAGNKAAASVIGKAIAAKATEAGITVVVFDRNGFKYHGRVQALAEAAREGGLTF